MTPPHVDLPFDEQESRRGFFGWFTRAGIVTIGAIAGLAATGAPAQAHSIKGGTGMGGWDNNHVICDGCNVSRGRIVRLWQGFMWTRRQDGTRDKSFTQYVDGIFGPITARSTRHYQEQNNLRVDGIVGPQTWGWQRRGLAYMRRLNGYDFHEFRNSWAFTELRRNVSTGVWQYRMHYPITHGEWKGTGHA